MSLSQTLGSAFVVTTELGPVKGVLVDESLKRAEAYLPLDGINVHDCPMGNLRINAVAMGSLVQARLGVEAIPHFTCRDRSLLGTQADLLGAHALGIRNLLLTTGDPPSHGPYPSKPVYDYATIDLIRLVKKMNRGLDHNEKEFGGKTEFRIACTARPAPKVLDLEIERMARKIEAGADFFQTQVAYDLEKTCAFLEKARALARPVLLGLMPLKSVKMARYVNENVDGIDVPDEVISRMEKGAAGIEIACDFVKEVACRVDGIHIMAMGDVAGTNQIVQFARSLAR